VRLGTAARQRPQNQEHDNTDRLSPEIIAKPSWAEPSDHWCEDDGGGQTAYNTEKETLCAPIVHLL
jgi:hypothetical protein